MKAEPSVKRRSLGKLLKLQGQASDKARTRSAQGLVKLGSRPGQGQRKFFIHKTFLRNAVSCVALDNLDEDDRKEWMNEGKMKQLSGLAGCKRMAQDILKAEREAALSAFPRLACLTLFLSLCQPWVAWRLQDLHSDSERASSPLFNGDSHPKTNSAVPNLSMKSIYSTQEG